MRLSRSLTHDRRGLSDKPISGVFARRVKSLGIETITDVSLTERRGGAGTITFDPVPPSYWWYQGVGWSWFGYPSASSFELAAEARQVYEIIRGAQRAAKRYAHPSAEIHSFTNRRQT